MVGDEKIWALVAAAGSGKRMQTDLPKQYLRLGRLTLLQYSLQPLMQHERVAATVVVLSADDSHWSDIPWTQDQNPPATCLGGKERYHSVLNGLEFISATAAAEDWVLVHDAARPCLQCQDLSALIETVTQLGYGGLLAAPVSDTIKRATERQHEGVWQVAQTVDRSPLWRALTPQMFRLGELKQAIASIVAQESMVTDEAEAMERFGAKVVLVPGSADNIKVTRPEDLAVAQAILERQHRFIA